MNEQQTIYSASPWAIGPALFTKIQETVPPGSLILELGSGEGTGLLAAAGYQMVSIESDPTWMLKYDSRYIYAPLRYGWYCPIMLRKNLPPTYKALLIDGPAGNGRLGMVQHFDLFNFACHVFVDDVNRLDCRLLAEVIAEYCKRPLQIFSERPEDGRKFALI